MSLTGKNNEEKIWNFLTGKGLNSYGAAGLMGNLFAESGLNPHNLQNTYEKKLGYTDDDYTDAVDSGKYTGFVHDSAGYGLAQWTFWSRKEALLNYVKAAGASIGDLETQLGFLWKELAESYAAVLAVLKKATSERQASDAVLLKYEQPKDQSASVQTKRASYGQTYFDKYATKTTNDTQGGNNMSVKIGHASIDENNRAHGGVAGDQTTREVCVRDWYAKGWTVLLRPKSQAIAEKMAKFCEEACANDLIGYDQYQRNTLRTQAKAAGWNAKKISVACETDCSAFMTVCAEAAGVDVSGCYTSGNAPVTSNMRAKFKATGCFDVLTDKKYLNSSEYVKRGDVLVYEQGHTAMVLSNGSKAGTTATSKGNTSYSGKGIGTATAKNEMNIRSGSGTNHGSYGTISKGTKVEVLEILSNGWYKIVWPGASCGYAYTSNTNGAYYSYAANTAASTAKKNDAAMYGPDKSLAGAYQTTAGLNLRTGASTNKAIHCVIPKGKTVRCYGYYNKDSSGTKWLYVVYGDKTGYCSSKYLKK